MKRKIFSIIFIIACIGISIIPFVGMAVAPSNEVIGNEQQTVFPSLKNEDGSFNSNFMQELGDYFSTHYSLRPEIISADAQIQSELFGISNLDSVIVGKNNWLYYSSTLDNYLGRNLMSARAVFNTLHNLELTQDYLTANGIEFLFTVAPNKNTLYPENMPDYYSIKESDSRDLDNFTSLLSKSNLNYCDLLSVLSDYEEALYHEQDSHWNNKGALIAYNTILDSIEKDHDSYEGAKAERTKTFYGDLGKMLYPSNQKPEYNYEYDIQQSYTYLTPTESVEEPIIATENFEAEGRLYMYRDSFGNALIPFFANAYNSAYFTKTFPVNLALDVQVQQSETVIFEIAERNLVWFAKFPPVIPASGVTVPSGETSDTVIEELKAEVSQVNMQYISISGHIDSSVCEDESELIVLVTGTDGTVSAYEAFTTVSDTSDYGFMAYIPFEELPEDTAQVSVAVKNTAGYLLTQSSETDIIQVEF